MTGDTTVEVGTAGDTRLEEVVISEVYAEGIAPAWKPKIVDSTAMTISGPNALIEMAIDKGFDIDRLRQLIELRDREEAKAAEKAFVIDFNAAQAEMKIIVKDSENKQKGTKFARLEAVNREVVPCVTKHGFAISCSERPATLESPVLPDCRRFVVTLMHVGGHSKEYVGDVPIDGKGAKGGDVMNVTQGYVSTGSYAQRIIICRALNLTIADSDRDGENDSDTLTEEQITILRAKVMDCEKVGIPINESHFIDWLGKQAKSDAKTFDEVRQSVFPRAITALDKKMRDARDAAAKAGA